MIYHRIGLKAANFKMFCTTFVIYHGIGSRLKKLKYRFNNFPFSHLLRTGICACPA